jgi:hypothetical protein
LFSAFIAEKYIKKKYWRNKKKKGNAMCPLSQTPV